VTDPIQLADLSILGTLHSETRHAYGIRTSMHEVYLRDGSLHRFHGVLDLGFPSQYLRALQLSDHVSYCVFDLRHLSRSLGADLCTCATRDMPGLVNYTLRELFATGHDLRTRIVAYSHVLGIPTPAQAPAQTMAAAA
jgi:energy-converting hydrogenase Eha subunit G